jgi:hypothetical protein
MVCDKESYTVRKESEAIVAVTFKAHKTMDVTFELRFNKLRDKFNDYKVESLSSLT